LEDLDGIDISPTLISQVTAAVLDEVVAWQYRPLDAVYPIVYLDAIWIKIRTDRVTQNQAVYLALGVNLEGDKELLGIWIAQKWDASYPMITKSWLANWERLAPFFDYPPEIRKVIYTTNAIESLNRSLRKIIKNRGAFPNEDAAKKLLYLAMQNIEKNGRDLFITGRLRLIALPLYSRDAFL
jgi:transposase-like protein